MTTQATGVERIAAQVPTPATEASTRPGDIFDQVAVEQRGVVEDVKWDPPSMPAVEPSDATKKVTSVVYVCDSTNDGWQHFQVRSIEINRSIYALEPDQAFNIILFPGGGDGQPVTMSRSVFVASAHNKDLAYRWLGEQQARRLPNRDPVPALMLAFSQHPRLVYLLTAHSFGDNAGVLRQLRRLNPDKSVRVSTIAYFAADAPASERIPCEDVQRRIAVENGGTFTSAEDTGWCWRRGCGGMNCGNSAGVT